MAKFYCLQHLYHNVKHCDTWGREVRHKDVWCVLGRTKCTTRTSPTSLFATVDLFTGQLPKSDASFHGAKPSHGVKALSVGRHVRVRLALNFAALPAPPAELRSVLGPWKGGSNIEYQSLKIVNIKYQTLQFQNIKISILAVSNIKICQIEYQSFSIAVSII